MKATKAEVAKRVEAVLRLRLRGAAFWDIREYAESEDTETGKVPWNVSKTQLWRYIKRSDTLLQRELKPTRDKRLARHLAQRIHLYAEAMKQGDLRTALAVLQDEAKLQRLYEPEEGNFLERILSLLPPQFSAEIRAALVQLVPATGQSGSEPLALGAVAPGSGDDLDGRGTDPLDPWQARLLRSAHQRILLLCSRQSGKSTTAAALALRAAFLVPRSLVLLLSPTLRQSGELFRAKVKTLYNALGRPVPTVQESALTMELANGSRVVSLPGDEETIRGYSGVNLLVIDEAARVPDDLYRAVRPMLAVSGGRLIALSTPFGRRGWFCDEWNQGRTWERVRITAAECPRIGPAFLAEERRSIGERWYQQEYFCEFMDMVGAVFSGSDIDALISPDVPPLAFPLEPAS